MSQGGVNLKTLLILKSVCCGLLLLLIVLVTTGGLAVVSAWLDTAWPLVAASVILAVGLWLWRRRVRSCTTRAEPFRRKDGATSHTRVVNHTR